MNGSEEKKQKTSFGTALKKLLSRLITGVLVFSMLISLTVTVKKVLGKEPDIFGFRIFYILSGSMEPTIPSGAAVLTKKCASYSAGDVISFRSSDIAIYGETNTHRIVSVDDSGTEPVYTTKGDANPVADDVKAAKSDVYGKVIWNTGKMDFLGSFLGLVMTPFGYIACILLPLIVVLSFMMKDFIGSVKEVKDEKNAEARIIFSEDSPEYQELLRREALVRSGVPLEEILKEAAEKEGQKPEEPEPKAGETEKPEDPEDAPENSEPFKAVTKKTDAPDENQHEGEA